MSDELNEELDSPNQPVEETVETEQVKDETPVEESEDLETLKEKNKKLFERAKKAEAEAKELKTKAKAPAPKVEAVKLEVSLKDQMALINAKVHEDDLEEVMDYAKYKGISIVDALKSPVILTTLRDKEEQRKTADATNTTGSRRVTTKLSDDTLLRNASVGTIDDSEEGIERLIEARLASKKKK
jgi:hypothetical protein